MKRHSSTRPGAVVPSTLPHKYMRVIKELGRDYEGEYEFDRIVTSGRDEESADLVSSELLNGKHAPALDIDVPAWFVDSSTPGHKHLYIDVVMSWRKYRLLLWVLQYVGIIEKGYYRASVARKGTHLRHPRLAKDVL